MIHFVYFFCYSSRWGGWVGWLALHFFHQSSITGNRRWKKPAGIIPLISQLVFTQALFKERVGDWQLPVIVRIRAHVGKRVYPKGSVVRKVWERYLHLHGSRIFLRREKRVCRISRIISNIFTHQTSLLCFHLPPLYSFPCRFDIKRLKFDQEEGNHR